MKKDTSGRIGVLLLGGASVFNRLINVITPIFLVRLLNVDQFGEYRLFWLIAGSIMLLAPLGMPRGLLYFLPRSSVPDQPLYVSQTIIFLSVTGLIWAIVVAPWNPAYFFEQATEYSFGFWISGFVFLWVVSSLLMYLPSANQNYRWHAASTVWLSILRNVLVVSIASATASLEAIYLGLTIFVLFKTLVLFYYCYKVYGTAFLRVDVSKFREQLSFSIPFGLSAILNQVQSKAMQWMVVFMFPIGALAIFSVARNVQALVGVLRRSMTQVIVPKMSKSDLKKNESRSLELNNRANLVASFIIFPIVLFLYVSADAVIELLYTESYSDAAPIMKILLIGSALSAVDVSNLLLIYKQKRFVINISVITLTVSIILGYIGGLTLGLEGVALGAIFGTILGKIIRFMRVSKVINVSIRKLQDWKTLTAYLVSAAIGAYISALTYTHFPWEIEIVKLLASAAIFSLTYLGLLLLSGHSRIILILLGEKQWADT